MPLTLALTEAPRTYSLRINKKTLTNRTNTSEIMNTEKKQQNNFHRNETKKKVAIGDMK